MKNIAIIAHSLSGGGIETVIQNLSLELLTKGYNIHIILLNDPKDTKLNDLIKIHFVGKKSLFSKISQIRPYLYTKKINILLEKEKIDFLISNFTDFSGMKIVDLLNFRNTITMVHSTQSRRRFRRHTKGNSILKRYKKYRVIKSFKNKKLVCVSDGVKEDLINNFNLNSNYIQTIYNPLNFDEIRKKSLIKNKMLPNESYIIHVGRFEIDIKRQDILLKSYKKSNIKQKLVLLGDGKDKSLIENLIKELDLEDRVILAGFDSNPYPWIKNAELFVFTSDYEGFGMVLVESLILNTPVVSTNCKSGPSEILTGELANYLVPVGEVDALSNKINDALDYYPEIKDEYIEKFSSDTIIKQYIKLIEGK